MDHRIDRDRDDIELPLFTTLVPTAASFSYDADKVVLFEKDRLMATAKSFFSKLRHLLFYKRTEKVSVFVRQQGYLFIVKYLVIVVFELGQFHVAAVALAHHFFVLLIHPHQVRVH